MHYRVQDTNGQIDARGGVTVAIAQDINPLNPREVAVAMAVCRRDDRFSKSIGRNIAAGRIQHYFDNPSSNAADHVEFYMLSADEPVKHQIHNILKLTHERQLRDLTGF